MSERFHEAVAAGNEQRVLIRFADNTVFTTEDISISNPLEFTEPFNAETDLTIGSCPSSYIKYAIINDAQSLDDFSFGKFNASIGVKVDDIDYTRVGNVSVRLEDGREMSGHDLPPYLRVNGEESADNVPWPVKSIIVDNGNILIIGDENWTILGGIPSTWEELSQYTWEEAQRWTWGELGGTTGYRSLTGATLPNNAWMQGKVRQWGAENRGVVVNGNTITEYFHTNASVFEYCPLGVFIADRPKIVRTGVVEVSAYDQMVLADTLLDDLDIPNGITHKDLFQLIGKYLDVPVSDGDFINSNRVVKGSINLQNVTAREVFSSIAEAACGYARFDRRGTLCIAWFEETQFTFDEHDYTWFQPSEYAVAVIDKLRVASAESDYGTILGEGKNAYVIEGNELLMSDSVEDITEAALPIFERLQAVPSLIPGEAALFTDWSLQSGDVIYVSYQGRSYRFPVYFLEMNWNGAARISVKNSGEPSRMPLDRVNRKSFRDSRKIFNIQADLNGLRVKAEELGGDVGDIVAELNVLYREIELKVSSNEIISALNLSTEGVKIRGPLVDITGTVSLNGDTVINEDGTLITKNMVAVQANITGIFTAPYTRIGQVQVNNSLSEGIFFSSTETFNPSKITATFRRDDDGEFHLTSTGGPLFVDTDYIEPIYLSASELQLSAHASDETLIIGRDLLQPDYSDLCVFPDSSTYSVPRGNLGTPAHPWDTCTADQFFSDNGIKSRSSRVLKEDICELSDMGQVIDRLVPVSFKYIADRKHRLHYGLIFEDTEPVAPILCDRGGERPEDCRIQYDAINIMLLREMQDVRKRLSLLEGRGGRHE